MKFHELIRNAGLRLIMLFLFCVALVVVANMYMGMLLDGKRNITGPHLGYDSRTLGVIELPARDILYSVKPGDVLIVTENPVTNTIEVTVDYKGKIMTAYDRKMVCVEEGTFRAVADTARSQN